MSKSNKKAVRQTVASDVSEPSVVCEPSIVPSVVCGPISEDPFLLQYPARCMLSCL